MTCGSCNAALEPEARFCPSCGHAIAPTEPSANHHLPSAQTASMVGREVGGRYRILAKLGEGGMGAVFRAEQISLKRKVALKVLRPELSADPGLVRRFNAEAELAAKLNHPNTVTLFDFGQDDDGSLYIAMEFVEGTSLRDVLVRSGPLPAGRLIDICAQVCGSLTDAHGVGIVHRDLKPDNVMLSTRGGVDDVVTVLDFGIAKLRDERSDGTSIPMTQQGDLLGTPQYMAPEQIRAEPVDGRTDVYALGAMMYEMVTGRLPFEGPTLMSILSKHLTEAPVPPIERRRDLGISPALSGLIVECMSKQPDQRPESMQVLGGRLATLKAQLADGGAARPVSMPVPRYHSRPPGVPQTTPADGHAPRTPAPAPMPAPMPMTPVPHTNAPHAQVPATHTPVAVRGGGGGGSKAWVWVVMAVVVAGGSAAGVYAWQSSRAGDETETAEAAVAGNGNETDNGNGNEVANAVANGAPGEELDNVAQVTGDFSTHPTRTIFEDGGDEPAGTPGFGSQPAAVDGAYVNPQYGYSIELPPGFTGLTDPNNPGMMTASGTVRGKMAMVVALALPIDPSLLGDDGLREAANNIASGFNGSVVKVEKKRIGDERLYSGIYDTPQGMRMQVVLYPGKGQILAVAFGTPKDAFRATAKTRDDLFESRVGVPR